MNEYSSSTNRPPHNFSAPLSYPTNIITNMSPSFRPRSPVCQPIRIPACLPYSCLSASLSLRTAWMPACLDARRPEPFSPGSPSEASTSESVCFIITLASTTDSPAPHPSPTHSLIQTFICSPAP
eukprot:GHVU01177676.1.p1 GENE.GHVU01177676.1~~GHVU01177676.1.p1  ORF type:complete len:125 (+),score=5.36 GHVU01177676.1:312-686(+)